MTNYIDFIDSPTIRDYLRTLSPLPVAQQCILISQSGIRPLEEKLGALEEIRRTTQPKHFENGKWKFQCNDSFVEILDRYTETRRKRLSELGTSESGIVYVVKSSYSSEYGTPHSTLSAALASIEPLEYDERPPTIHRMRIDNPDCTTLVASLSRKLEIVDVDEHGGPNDGSMHIWSGDLPNGYAYVPHPFKCGDIIRQGESYYVLGESVESGDENDVRGIDESDMVLFGMSWSKENGSFVHEHIFYTHLGTELVLPAELPKSQKMLAAVSNVMKNRSSLIGFLECFTNGYRDELERD